MTGTKTTRRQRFVAGGAAALLAAVGLPTGMARAAATIVDCDGSGDIGSIQAAIDAAADGDVIALRGTCDISAAPAHGGGPTSVAHAAIAIRPGTPVNGLTITSAGSPQSASVVGSGTQAAFLVAPGNDGTTISGLRFVNVGRAVVVAGAAGATIGSASATGATPEPAGNLITGGATMDSAIHAFATSATQAVAYGEPAASGQISITPAAITGLAVRGNDITYTPPALSTAPIDPIAIDVRQGAAGTVAGVTIARNAVAMVTSDAGSVDLNGIRVQGLTAVPASSPAATADYRITGVTIADNDLGRRSGLDDTSSGGVAPNQVETAGRTGVLLHRVGSFTVTGNEVRSRLSGGVQPAVGGGIVAADSAFGRIDGNQVVTIADPGTADVDLGAIGVVDGLGAALGSGGADQATAAIEVTGNSLGTDSGGTLGVQRGVHVAGADLVTVHSNVIDRSTVEALSLAGRVSALGSDLPRGISRVVACDNSLDGNVDNTAEVRFGDGTGSLANSFPGGEGYAGNNACAPRLVLNPNPLGDGEPLYAGGRSWASRSVEVVLTDGLGATLSRTATAAADGTFQVTFAATEVGGMADGTITGVATATDQGGFSKASAPAQAVKNAVVDNPLAGTATILDKTSSPIGVDGYTNRGDILYQPYVRWTAPADGRAVASTVWFSTPSDVIPSGCGPFRIARPNDDGKARLNGTCGNNLPEGDYFFNVQWHAADGETSPVVSVASTKDVTSRTPAITYPAQTSFVPTTSVTFTGTAEPGATVTVREGRTSQIQVFGTTTALTDGTWSFTAQLEERYYDVNVYYVDIAGNRSASSEVVGFTVDTTPADSTPPDPPVIVAPVDGDSVGATQEWRGTAEPGSRVSLHLGTLEVKTAFADAAGNWHMRTGFSPSNTYTVVSRATDGSGNVSASSTPVTIFVDASRPRTQIDTPPDSVFVLTATGARQIAGTGFDDDKVVGARVQFYDAAGKRVPAPYALPATLTGPPGPQVGFVIDLPSSFTPGVYYAEAYSIDAAGNQGLLSSKIRFFVVP